MARVEYRVKTVYPDGSEKSVGKVLDSLEEVDRVIEVHRSRKTGNTGFKIFTRTIPDWEELTTVVN